MFRVFQRITTDGGDTANRREGGTPAQGRYKGEEGDVSTALHCNEQSGFVREKSDTLLLGDGEILKYFPVLLGGGGEGCQGGEVMGMGTQAIRRKGGDEIKVSKR
jgi:hypothetical protein